MPRKSAKKEGNAGFLTELGIDRLHLEPKIDFLSPGTPKNPQNPENPRKKSENPENPDFWGQVGGMGRSLEMRRGSRSAASHRRVRSCWRYDWI